MSGDLKSDDAWVETPDGRLFARIWHGEDEAESAEPPIILLHDSLGSVALWRDFPAQLAAGSRRRVIAYDRLGFGRSDPHPHKLGADFVENEARASFPALRAALDIDRMVLFGHSVGGAMAVGVGTLFPDDVIGIVVESSQMFVEDRTLQGIRDAEVNFRDPAQRQRLARYHGDKTDWVLEAWIGSWLDEARRDWTTGPLLRRLQCPVLALHGDCDEFGSYRHPELIVEMVPAPSEMVLLEGCGHVPHREMPARVIEPTLRFVERL